jgi:LacI family transcriptional regulator
MAIGLLCAFRERHVRVPEDVAVTGFDDIPTARFVNPPLTTVRVPITELGADATSRLLECLESGGSPSGCREILPTTLVVRSSCGGGLRVEASSRCAIPSDYQSRPDSRFSTTGGE